MAHAYGWKRQLPDRRDYRFAVSPSIIRGLPERVDLRDKMPEIWDQGQLGSCTAQAVAAAFQYDQILQTAHARDWNPSRLFIYMNERIIEGTVPWDSGAEMRDAIKAVVEYGCCPETDWPYDIGKFAIAPPKACYETAILNQGLVYCAVEQSLCQMQGVLASGFPFILGFSVYSSFEEVGSDGLVPMPGNNESLLGGHAVVAVGYDNPARRFIVRNSWGEGFGDEGHVYFPYEYLTDRDLSSDFWVLSTVEVPDA